MHAAERKTFYATRCKVTSWCMLQGRKRASGDSGAQGHTEPRCVHAPPRTPCLRWDVIRCVSYDVMMKEKRADAEAMPRLDTLRSPASFACVRASFAETMAQTVRDERT